ncbi:MAG: methylenetetrahydrofolate reductase [Treponema sp.]|jgi:methylenetetrahydrofolate reductase (NADPH)|nr:methylenetetrahydrofolate reductase [Treponema sp.]
MIVSLEAVPRNPESLAAAADTALRFRQIGLINIPDLLRFSLRSWEACALLRDRLNPAVELLPHIRAMDFDPAAPFPHAAYFRSLGIRKVLVIAGDPPAGDPPAGAPPQGKAEPLTASGRRPPPPKTPAFIRKLKAEMPELEIFAAFDPYRTNIRYELDYLAAKEAAGAAGFMSQPFFDLRLLEIYAEYLEGKNVFWGVSPVLSESGRGYWESRNRAIFPRSFRPTLAWNLDFGRQVLRFCESGRFNLYLMPIKIDLAPYLAGLF